MKRVPIPLADWCTPEAPWGDLGFRYYAPSDDTTWAPLLLLGAELDEDAVCAWRSRTDGLDARGLLPVLSPLAWRARRDGDVLLRVAHQCGGMTCTQRHLVGFALTPTAGARAALDRALDATYDFTDGAFLEDPLREGVVPGLSELLRVEDALRPLGWSCERTYPRLRHAFVAALLAPDGREAAAALAPHVEDALPGDLAELLAPCACDVPPRFALFVLGANED